MAEQPITEEAAEGNPPFALTSRDFGIIIPSAPEGITTPEASEAQLHEILKLCDTSSEWAADELRARGLEIPDWYDASKNVEGYRDAYILYRPEGIRLPTITGLAAPEPADWQYRPLWEYQTIDGQPTDDALNRVGADGWELVAVVNMGASVLRHTFKRLVLMPTLTKAD